MAPLLIKFDLSTSDIILRNQVLTELLDFVKSQHFTNFELLTFAY